MSARFEMASRELSSQRNTDPSLSTKRCLNRPLWCDMLDAAG